MEVKITWLNGKNAAIEQIIITYNYVYMNLPTIGTSFTSGKRSHLDIPAMRVKLLRL